MKEFKIEDLEIEKINAIQLEKVFHTTNKENKDESNLVVENNFIGLRIFTNKKLFQRMTKIIMKATMKKLMINLNMMYYTFINYIYIKVMNFIVV